MACGPLYVTGFIALDDDREVPFTAEVVIANVSTTCAVASENPT